MNQEQKDYLLKVEAEINKMFYEIHDLLSEEAIFLLVFETNMYKFLSH